LRTREDVLVVVALRPCLSQMSRHRLPEIEPIPTAEIEPGKRGYQISIFENLARSHCNWKTVLAVVESLGRKSRNFLVCWGLCEMWRSSLAPDLERIRPFSSLSDGVSVGFNGCG
jgi:hypothetical protein